MFDFDSLYREMQGWPRSNLLRTGCGDETDDILHDALLKTIEADRKRVVEIPLAYTCGVLRRMRAGFYAQRKINRERIIECSDTPTSAHLAVGLSTLDELVAAERRTAIENAIGKLPPIQRAVVIGFFFNANDAQEIAAELRLTMRQFWQAKQHAIERLRELLRVERAPRKANCICGDCQRCRMRHRQILRQRRGYKARCR